MYIGIVADIHEASRGERGRRLGKSRRWPVQPGFSNGSARPDPAVLAYMATMRPQRVLEDCRSSHVDPCLDATRVE
jgi:hypothetical protein